MDFDDDNDEHIMPELHIALSDGNVELLKQLMDDDNADVHFDAGYDVFMTYIGTPLLQAARHGRSECLIYLQVWSQTGAHRRFSGGARDG
jgi:hypothetical protein